MQMQNARATGTLVKVVDILRNQCELRQDRAHPCDSSMRGVRLSPKYAHAAPFVPPPHQFRIAHECVWRRKLRWVIPLPEPDKLIAKSRDAAFGRYPGSSENRDVARLAQVREECCVELWRRVIGALQGFNHVFRSAESLERTVAL